MPHTQTAADEISLTPDGAVALPERVGVPSAVIGPAADTPAKQRIRRREAIFRRTLAAADVAAFFAAFGLGAVVVGGAAPRAWVVAFPIGLIALAKAVGLYDRDANTLAKRTLTELPSLIGVASLVTLGSWLVAPVIVDGPYGRPAVGAFGLSFLTLLILIRTAARENALRRATAERCLLVGDGLAVEELRDKLVNSRVVKAEVLTARALDTHPAAANGSGPHETNGAAEGGGNGSGPEGVNGWHGDGDPALPSPTELEARIERDGVERVVLTADLIESGDLLEAVRRLQLKGVRVSLLPPTARVPGSAVELDQVDGVNLFGVKACEITRSSRLLKRSLDLAVSIGGLVLLSPLMAAIAVAVRLESRGEVIYRQVRIGRNGEPFSILKFRTMFDGAHADRDSLELHNEADGLFKVVDDPRVTRVGRWLRRTSLDELPQLVNVLRGEMSLVGPRPLVPEEDCLVLGHYRRRLDVSPGMTGHWQVLGSWRVPLGEMVKLDHQYVANWSLWGDLELLLRTMGHVLSRRGA